jgi:hypothetical protein
MRTISIAAVLVASGCWSQSAAPRNTPVANVGPAPRPAVVHHEAGYRRTHVIRYVCDGGDDGWCDAGADDTLVIHDARAGAIAVEIELMQTNGHSCTFDGVLAPVRTLAHGVSAWVFDHADDDEEDACTLTLERSAAAIRISSDGCRSYCGARASLDVTFAETDRLREPLDADR